MSRVKRGIIHTKKRERILKSAKGFKWGRKNLIKAATTAVKKAGVHAYRDRKIKKRTRRGLWQIQLNAAARQYGLSYSKFINLLKKKNIGLDRKVLSEIANANPNIFKAIVEQIKK